MRRLDKPSWIGVAAVALAVSGAGSHAQTGPDGPSSTDPGLAREAPAVEPSRITTALARQEASADARYLGRWIQARDDNAGLPFAIVDKRDARIHVFDGHQQLVASSVVLVGSAYGDSSTPGVGRLAQVSRLGAADRTTPAGRYASEPGRNLHGEDIVWFDYGAALAIHRLRSDAAQERRAQRMATPSPDDNRASLGCVVVPVHFYEQVVKPLLGQHRGVVYVLPESSPVQAWWPTDAEAYARLD